MSADKFLRDIMHDLDSYNPLFLSVPYFLTFYSSNFEIILVLQKNYKDISKNFHIAFTQLLLIVMSCVITV